MAPLRRRRCGVDRRALPATGDAEVRVDDAAGYQPDNVAQRQCSIRPPAVPIAVVVADPTGVDRRSVCRARADGRRRRPRVRRRCARRPRGAGVDRGRAVAHGGDVRARHAHARSQRPRADQELPGARRPGVAGAWARTSIRARWATCLATKLVVRRGAGADTGRDDDCQRRPSSHFSSVSESVRRAWGRPSGAASASKRSGGPHGAGAVLGRRCGADRAGGRRRAG